MKQNWSFINSLCASELRMLNEACKLSNTKFGIKSEMDVYLFIENKLGQKIHSYSSMLEKLNNTYYNYHGLLSELGLSWLEEHKKDITHISNLDEDTLTLSRILLWILLSNDEARDIIAREEKIGNSSKEMFEKEFFYRLSCSKKFKQKVPFYALSLSGLGKVVQRNNDMRWLTVSSAVGIGLSIFRVTPLLAGPIFGAFVFAETVLDFIMGSSNKAIKDATPFWVALIFIHMSSSMTINTEQMAKDFCRGLINDDNLKVPRDFQSKQSMDAMREILPGWNSIRIGLVIYLWGILSKNYVTFRKEGSVVVVRFPWRNDGLNSERLTGMSQSLFDKVPLRKLGELRPYAKVLIDYIYGLDVDDSLKNKYIQVSNHYNALDGKKLLVDYCFPYTEVNSNTYCYCLEGTNKGIMTQLYFECKGVTDNHCLYDIEDLYFHCIVVPPLISSTNKFERYLSSGGQIISIETKSEKAKKVKKVKKVKKELIDLETEYAVIRHDILKHFEEISFDIDNNQLDVAKRGLTDLKDWFSTYFMTKKSVSSVDIEKILYEQFNEDFTLRIEKFGFSSKAVVMINESDFKIRVLKNLADNFKKHAFASMPDKEQRQVLITLTCYDQQTEVRISNNGEPIPDELCKDSIFNLGVKGKRTGNLGIGCWSMRKCLRSYDGDIRLETNHDSLFPTTFIITLTNYMNDEKNDN